ncbi:uncharacterized protein LOC106669566 isoform X2 [Cimex lectularius]|uniref:Uncharacterized protein n=1 Tax=Cimex lectularius TaxID=79782 RepID=A0A8I6RY16_CIMLE|nr:uncharacterized protein LOC106669566 isoform X2 [Cimex lectularius]
MVPFSNHNGLPLEKRYPQEIEMVKPILLPSLYNRHSTNSKIPLEKKYPIESELVQPVKLPHLSKTGPPVSKSKPWMNIDRPSEKKQKKEEPRRTEDSKFENTLGLVKRFAKGSKYKYQPTSKKPPPDIVPAVIRDQTARSKDIPRKNKPKMNFNPDNEPTPKTSTRRLTLVERLRQRIDARRKAQKIAMMENEFLTGNDKLEAEPVKSPKEHTIGTTLYTPKKEKSVEAVSEIESRSEIEPRRAMSDDYVEQLPLSWDFLHTRKETMKHTRQAISPRRGRTVTKLNRTISPRRCSKDRSVKTSSPEAEVFEPRRCEVSRPKSAGYKRTRGFSRDRPKTTSFTEVVSPREVTPKTPPQQPKTAKTYYVGCSREPSDTDRDYESDFEEDNSIIKSQKTNKSHKSGRSRKSYNNKFLSDFEKKKPKPKAKSYRNKEETDVSSGGAKPKSKIPWNKRNNPRAGFPYKRRKSSDFEESSEKIQRPRRQVTRKKPNTVIPSDRRETADSRNAKTANKFNRHSNQGPKRSSSDVIKNRPEWVSSKRFEPLAPAESFTIKNTHKRKFKHIQPRYLEPKKPKPTPPETPPTPPKKNPKLRTVQSRYLETPNCLKITHSIKSLLERNADRLKGCFPKHVVTHKTSSLQKKKLEPLKPISQFRPPIRNKEMQKGTTNEKRERQSLSPKNAKSKPTHLNVQQSFEKPPAIDFSQDVVNRKDDMRRVFPKRLYDDLYTSRTGNRELGNLYSRDRQATSKANISNRFKQFDHLLASTQKTFKKKFEFSDLSDADEKDTKHFENSFKSILKECDAINDLLTPVLLPPPSAKMDRAFGKYLTNDKPKSASQNTDYPNFLTWKTDFIQDKKPLNTFTALHETKFPKTNDNSSSFTKGQYSVDSELATSFPSLTSTPEKSKEVLSNTDDCLTPDCYCKRINTLSSISMTYAVCPTSTVGDPDMLSPISSLPELTKKKSESSFSTPTCYCSSAYKSSTSNCNMEMVQKENSLNELKKKIEEAIVQISLKKPKSKHPIRQSLPPLRKPSSHVKFLESIATKTSSSMQTETPPPLMPGKRQPLCPLSKTTNGDFQSSQTKKRNLFTYPVQIPDPILEQIYQSQNALNDQIRLPKKFTPLPSIFDRNTCNFCPELNKNLNEYLSSSTSSTSLSSISSLPLPWNCSTKKSMSPKESKNSNPSKSKQEKQVFRCSPPSSPFVRNMASSLKPYSSYTSSSQKSFIGDSKFINNPLIEYSFPPAEPIHSILKSPLPSILKTSHTKTTRKLSDVKTRMNSPGKKAPKLKNPRGIIQLQPEHSSTVVSGVDTLNTLRSISLSGLDTEKFMYSGSRKVTSEISVRKTKVSSKRTSSGRMEERFPKEVEPVRPVLLPSVRAKKFSQSKLYVSGQQQNTDGDSTTCLSSSLPTLSFITQHVQQSPPDFKQEHSREEEGKTEMSEKCCLSRTPMTSSIEITGVPNEIPKPSINRIEQFLQKTSLAGRNESSLIHIHKTTAVMNVHHNERDPSAESFLDSSTAGSISICDYLQGEQLRTNMRDGVGHRFFRKPPPVVTELIEIKSECPPVVCERSISDILPHAAPAKMNILQHGDRSASVRQSSQSPTRKENLEAGDSVTVEDSVTQLAETESLAAMSSTQTEKLSDTSTTSTTSSSQSESTNETQTEPEAEESSEKPAAAPEVIVQTAVVEVKGEKTDVSCSQVEPSEKSALKTEQVDVSVSVQSLGSIPPLSPSDVMIGGSPRKNRSLSDVRRGASPQNRRNAPQEGVGYSFFRGEFDPPVRKPKIDSCVQTEKYQRPKKQCTMTSVDVVD